MTSIERSLEVKEFTMVAFLDIEGAFNNIKLDSITKALTNLEIDSSLVSFIKTLLERRIIFSELGSHKLTRYVSRGTPQGGVLYPLL